MNHIVCLAAMFATCLSADFAQAARLLIVRIEHNGNVAQSSFYEDDGTADTRTIWSYLGGDPLAVEGGGTIVASPNDPLRATLTGPVAIAISHAKAPLLEARIENLTLTRVRADRDRWFLPPDELRRTGIAAGLVFEDERPKMNSQDFWVRVLGIVVFLVAVFVIGYFLRRARTASAQM